ncbi:unnamed protein product [Protopolystoma xenopodis]|uniref:Uncharacterized protein n=1 Tax=Protopolystoma xenopodis TaxID=117903 RepID=A0A448X6U9_9PLAT|nr:unnamed protein product [Protopolystoma xenopodis]
MLTANLAHQQTASLFCGAPIKKELPGPPMQMVSPARLKMGFSLPPNILFWPQPGLEPDSVLAPSQVGGVQQVGCSSGRTGYIFVPKAPLDPVNRETTLLTH